MLKFKGTLSVLRKFFQGLCRNKICSKLLVEGMFALHFFCQGTHCPDTVGGQICVPLYWDNKCRLTKKFKANIPSTSKERILFLHRP